MRRMRSTTALLALCLRVAAHGAAHPQEGESIQQYAARHMASEHHIDAFDVQSFFKLHDLNRNGFWERDEIEAVYGVHHAYAKSYTKTDEEHQRTADTVVNTLLTAMDTDNDGKISLAELEAKGLDALPNFAHLGAEGHHYDIESEFFLHHEETYHSTPDTQTDESYNHPEDLEHFAQHEEIEAEEERRERIFQGLPDEAEPTTTAAPAASDNNSSDATEGSAESEIPADKVASPPPLDMPQNPHDDQHVLAPAASETTKGKKINRINPPGPKYANIVAAFKEGSNRDEWGQGDQGYKRPKSPADKMRRNLPYKYKFRRNWGDF